MKMRQLVVATSAALISFGAIAGGQQQSESKQNTAPQAATDSSIIREAQEKLSAEGYAPTPQGLREFQQAKGIQPSGQLDQQTLAALGVGASASSGATSDTAPQPRETPKY